MLLQKVIEAPIQFDQQAAQIALIEQIIQECVTVLKEIFKIK